MMRNTSKTSKDATAVGFLGPHGSRGVQFDSDSAEFGGSNSFNEQNSSTISSDIKCGDMQPIAREFRQHYEKKLKEAAADNSGDGVQVKMKLQEDWIRDLTEQNDMLIRAVLELETEATERVKMLEEKLKESAACACEAREAANMKHKEILEIQQNALIFGEGSLDESDQFRQMKENYSTLKQAMQDVRDALTSEVADKHDAILALRRDVQTLEERCRRADQQTHFKDDIIKELRKDLKHLKLETSCDSVCDATQNLVAELEQENRELKATIKQAYWELEQLENKTEVFLDGSEHSIDCNCKPEETKLNVCPAKEIYNKMEMKDLRARIGVESKNKCPTSNLEGVINILSVSVSQMMMRHSSSKSSNKRIQDLEEQLQQTLRNKDFDIEEERNRRNIEINNLISTIQEQEESLQNLQNQSKNLQDAMNINTLESTIKDMKEEQNQLYHVIDSQKSELQDCMLELNNLQTVLSEQCICEADVSGVEQRLTDTLKANELLVTENSILKTKVCCDCKTSHVYQDRIDELQRVVADKNVELNRWHSIANDFQQKLEAATQKQASLEHSVNAMQRNMAKNDIVCVLQNEETDACREEVDCCLGELRELKGKLNLDASVYSQKAEEAQSLKSRCLLQTGTIDVLRRDLKDERIRHRDEVLNLKQQIRELKDHDTQLDFDNRKHIERIQHLEQSVHEHSERTLHLTAEAKLRESELAEKVSNTQSEEIRLVAEVTQLEERAALLDSEVQRLRVELDKVTQVCADRQTEMASLKTEVNLLLQRQAKLKAENTKLRNQINCLQRTKHGNTGNTEKLMSQLDNCLRQLEQLHVEKDFLAVQCDQMTSELLQLQQVMQMKDAELLHLQTQLDDTRANRDEVCAESRTVVSNVRQWLHHQTAISEQVKGKIRRLERDNRELQQTINEMSGGACCSCRMRAGSPVRSESCIISQSFPHQHSNVWSLNSNGGTQSPTSVGSSADDSSVNYSSGSENEVEMKLDVMSPPEVWLHKVENMTAEIQRSNLYWKSKLYKTDTVTDDN